LADGVTDLGARDFVRGAAALRAELLRAADRLAATRREVLVRPPALVRRPADELGRLPLDRPRAARVLARPACPRPVFLRVDRRFFLAT
jgi:hypothetical protein